MGGGQAIYMGSGSFLVLVDDKQTDQRNCDGDVSFDNIILDIALQATIKPRLQESSRRLSMLADYLEHSMTFT